MAPNTCFESLSFVPFSTDESFINNENDPDVNFYNDVFTLDTQYLAPDKFQRNFKPFSKQSLFILHPNIRSINKNFEAVKQFYLSLNFNFSIVCFSETWANDININKNSFQLRNYNTEHQIRKSGKGGGICIFIYDSLDYKVRKDLSINCDAIESLSIEICKRKTRNTIFNVVCRPPNGDTKISEQFCKDLFSKNSKNLKNMILAGDFNINALDYEQNKKVQSFFNLMYRYNMIRTINQPTSAGKNSATAIDHIIANCIVDCQFKTAILKTDVTDHFPIAMALKTDEPVHQSQKVQNVHKRYYNENAIESFKQRLREIDLAELKKC